VVELRDGQGLPYFKIAERLTGEGWVSSRGGPLCHKKVFSVYRKRKLRSLRLAGARDLKILDLEISE
jgi:hypothetical protein